MPIPSPVHNKTRPNYLVIDGKLTNAGKSFLKMMNVYSKANRAYRLGLNGLSKCKYN